MNIGYVWVLANYPGDAGAVDLDTPAKMLDRLFNEVINDVVNMDENKTHILNKQFAVCFYRKFSYKQRIAFWLRCR